MKKIILLGAAPIHGKIRFPSEGVFTVAAAAPTDDSDRVVTADEAAGLVDVGLAIDDDVHTLKVDELRGLADKEGANVGPADKKADLVDAIRDHRENNDGGDNG